MKRGTSAGVTLLEVLIAVTLLSLLSVGMLMAMRIGFSAYSKTQTKLMDNRRIAGAQRILEQELQALIPVVANCVGSEAGGRRPFPYFQGDHRTMRLVSGFSLQQAWRGRPQVLELFVIPGAEGRGVRLVVNETPYTGPLGAGALCMGFAPDLETGKVQPIFPPVAAKPTSFVLGDKLAYCRFAYLVPAPRPMDPPVWKTTWSERGWPFAIRVEMAPLEPNPARLQPVTVMAPIYVTRKFELRYRDE